MSDAIKKLHDYLAMSPSVVYPEDVLAYLPAIGDENAKLRELVRDMWLQLLNAYDRKEVDEFADRMRELSMEVVR